MITVETAMTFDRVRVAATKPRPSEEVREEEQALFDYLDGTVESGILKAFDGSMLDLKIPIDLASPELIGALKARYERGGWNVTVIEIHENVLACTGNIIGIQVVFAPGVVLPSSAALSNKPAPVEHKKRVVPAKPRVMLVSDVPGWAFDQNMRDLAAYLEHRFDFGFFFTENWWKGERPNWDDWDVIYEAYHRNPHMGIPMERAVGALRSEWWDPVNPTPPTPEQIARVNEYRGFQVAVQRNLEEYGSQCPGVVYLTNPVNMKRFEQTEERDGIVASWNGNARHQAADGRYIKHFYDIAMPAALRAGVPLVVAEYGTKEGPQRRRAPSEMPAFYAQANVALCTSEYEAASNSVMEAMAAGLALIVTDVGNHREMRDAQMKAYGDSGILLVERSVPAFASALRELTPKRARQMGEINRAEIAARWSWAVWRDRYQAFLEMAL